MILPCTICMVLTPASANVKNIFTFSPLSVGVLAESISFSEESNSCNNAFWIFFFRLSNQDHFLHLPWQLHSEILACGLLGVHPNVESNQQLQKNVQYILIDNHNIQQIAGLKIEMKYIFVHNM